MLGFLSSPDKDGTPRAHDTYESLEVPIQTKKFRQKFTELRVLATFEAKIATSRHSGL